MQKRTFLMASAAAALASAVIFGRLLDEPASSPEPPISTSAAPVASSAFPTAVAPGSHPAKDDQPVAVTSESRPSAAAFVPRANPTASQPLSRRTDTFSAPAPRSADASYRHPATASQGGPRPSSAHVPVGTVSGKNAAPAVASGFNPGNTSPNPAPSIAVELDRGVQLPIVLLEDEQARTPVQSAVKSQIAAQFTEQINQAATVAPTETADLDRVWSSAQARANWEYQKFFGGEAANRAGLRAGLEALAEP